MNKTKIEWCDSTWNPVTGCNHGCEYCYARGIANRFGKRLPDRSGYPEAHGGAHCLDSKIKDNPYPYIFEPTFLPYRLKEPAQKTKPQTIFVCSMSDLFGAWVPNDWIEEVFEACKTAPQHRYLFLTKNPYRYQQLLMTGKLIGGEHIWLGTTLTAQGKLPFEALASHQNFVSLEPLLAPVVGGKFPFSNIQWVIIGAETGTRKDKVVPELSWIEDILAECDAAGIPVFMKNSLIPIVGEENMRRDFPWGGGHGE